MKRLGIWIVAGLLVGCTSGSGEKGGSGGSGREAGQGGGSDTGGTGGKGNGGSGGKAVGGTGGKSTGGSGGSGTTDGGTNGTLSGGTGGTVVGTGGAAATGGTGGTAVAGCTELTGTVRDFVSSHDDFQYVTSMSCTAAGGDVCAALAAPGMVKPALENGKPMLSTSGPFKDANGFVQSVSGASFDEWWTDSAKSKSLQRKFKMEKRSAQLNSFGSEMFFPIDGEGWGNTDYAGIDKPATDLEKTEDDAHNQLFTVEINAEFLYEKGKNQIFITESDDDSWIFINGKLAIDNGGLHGFSPASASLDPIANDLGLESGKSYPIAMYFADRQLSGAKYRVSTNATFTKCTK